VKECSRERDKSRFIEREREREWEGGEKVRESERDIDRGERELWI
jgi:hypothetical protein